MVNMVIVKRNSEEDDTLEFSVAQNVVVGNSYFIKNDNHVIIKR